MSDDQPQPQSGPGQPAPGQPYPAQHSPGQPYPGQPYAAGPYPAQGAPPPSRPTKPRPRGWWWLGPGLLLVGAVVSVVAAVAIIAGTLSQPRTEVPVDGSAYEVDTTVGSEYLLWSDDSVSFLNCVVTDDAGDQIPVSSPNGSFEVNEWEAVGQFTASSDPVSLACTDDASVMASSVRVSVAPQGSDVLAGVVLMIVVPIILGGIAFVWGLVLLILTVTRPSRRSLSTTS